MALVMPCSAILCRSRDPSRALDHPAARASRRRSLPSPPTTCNLRFASRKAERSAFSGRTLSPSARSRNSALGSRGLRSGAARAVFTGIVEEIGAVRELRRVENGGFEMTIEGRVVLEDVKLGDSISVDGACLTVMRFDAATFSVGLAPETLRRTALGEAAVGAAVNLERSVQPSSRMGGHIVQGHVDGTGTITSFRPEGDSLWVKVTAAPELLRYVVPKGYVAVDGTSLTVVDVLDDESAFTFMLVAYTQQKIVIPQKRVGSKVNLEVDIVGKYVERLLRGYLTDAGSGAVGVPAMSPAKEGVEVSS